MPGQVGYYDRFGDRYRESILSCPEPEYWTTDYAEKGRVYQEIRSRVAVQQEIITQYFNKQFPILDIGCGFGRQAVWLARNGYQVTGVDTSPVFIEIAKALFEKNDLNGMFICTDLNTDSYPGKFRQAIMLDVFEHIPVNKRKNLVKAILRMIEPGGLLFISLPQVKSRLSSQINNKLVKKITQHFSWFLKKDEHPYPIPGTDNIKSIFLPAFSLVELIQKNGTDFYILKKN